MRGLSMVIATGLLLAACGDGGGDGGTTGSGGSTGTGGSSGGGTTPTQTGIQAMTQVNVAAGTGYFQDPYPIRLMGSALNSNLPTFSGTTKQLLTCSGALQPGCFAGSPVTLNSAAFSAQVAAAGSSIVTFENLNIYQDSGGTWQMAVTAILSRPDASSNWSVIVHATPTSPGGGIPTAWSPDAVLVGKLDQPFPDNYDGKYFQDSGTLYLIYNKQLVQGQEGVVAQAMLDAKTPATGDPVPLLEPETANGGYNSEIAYGLNQPSMIKLIETGNVTKINGKYVMTYSDGTYNRDSYKSGIAWSDTFLPPSGTYYKRVQKTDTAGVWGQANHAEILYLLQSQISQWPNYVATKVLAPGVPAIITDASGNYYLTFAGYDPSDAPTNTSGLYMGAKRRPYYVPLKVQVPTGSSVSGTAAQDLASWVTPVLAP